MKNQIVSKPNNWLYKDRTVNVRFFEKEISLPDYADYWPECTNEDKELWEKEHPLPEPEPEPNTQEQ